MRKPIGITAPIKIETLEEKEAFNEVERRSKVKLEILANPSKESRLKIEIALLTEMVRHLSNRVTELEKK